MEKPIAVKSISNTCSIAIFDIIYGINEYVLSAFIIDDNYIDKKRTNIFYDYKGDAYFYRRRKKYYIKDFISNF